MATRAAGPEAARPRSQTACRPATATSRTCLRQRPSRASVASVGSTALYAAATSGQEASLGTLTPANLAKLIGLVDPAYHRLGCSYYMSAADAATVFGASSGILANASNLSLFGYPVEITNAATKWATGTVSGPVFGRLDRFMSMRRVNGVAVQVLRERFADSLQVGINVYGRFDFQPRGETTAVAFSK
jgi:HK97 family phage major capsid protein